MLTRDAIYIGSVYQGNLIELIITKCKHLGQPKSSMQEVIYSINTVIAEGSKQGSGSSCVCQCRMQIDCSPGSMFVCVITEFVCFKHPVT